MRTLLLVDDQRRTLAVAKSFLESRDFKVFATTSAREGLELAEGIQPDLIIVEYGMREMKGDEVCRLLKQNDETARIPVLILATQSDEVLTRRAREAGAAGVVLKAAGRESLLSHVMTALGISQRRHVRVPCVITAGLVSDGEELRGLIHNISVSGIYLTIESPLAVGKAVRIRFGLPGTGAALDVRGEVVRTEKLSGSLYGYGVRMLETDEDAQTAVREFVERSG